MLSRRLLRSPTLPHLRVMPENPRFARIPLGGCERWSHACYDARTTPYGDFEIQPTTLLVAGTQAATSVFREPTANPAGGRDSSSHLRPQKHAIVEATSLPDHPPPYVRCGRRWSSSSRRRRLQNATQTAAGNNTTCWIALDATRHKAPEPPASSGINGRGELVKNTPAGDTARHAPRATSTALYRPRMIRS